MLPPLPALAPGGAPGDPDEEDEMARAEEGLGLLASAEVAMFDPKMMTVDTRPPETLTVQLNKITYSKPPKIHEHPAPPVIPPLGDPTLPHPRAPASASVGVRRSYFDRFLDSTLGRFSLFVTTLLFANVSILGLVSWNQPKYIEEGSSLYYFSIALFVLLAMFIIPLLAERAGMSALETGWKPYLVLYRLSFLMAIPAVVLQVLGTGAEVGFGMSSGVAGELKLENLAKVYWNYFELADGFVALNLTKGVTETLAPEEHGVPDHRRFSRFRDAELAVNKEPFSDQPEPTETPGRLTTYRMAPIFTNWAPCTTRYRISTQCLAENPIRAWAVSKSTSLCSSFKSVGCRPPKPYLEPVYKCSTPDRAEGSGSKNPIQGLCGHVAMTPPEGALDELGALLLYDAWPKIALPTSANLFLDVTPDDCINNPAACKVSWSKLSLAGLVFQIVMNLFVVIAIYMDCRVDYKIRKALKFMEQEEAKERLGLTVDTNLQKGKKKKKAPPKPVEK